MGVSARQGRFTWWNHLKVRSHESEESIGIACINSPAPSGEDGLDGIYIGTAAPHERYSLDSKQFAPNVKLSGQVLLIMSLRLTKTPTQHLVRWSAVLATIISRRAGGPEKLTRTE